MSDEKECKKSAESFLNNYYNLRLDNAAKQCTPESKKWLQFIATNLHEGDLALIDSMEQETHVSADKFNQVNDSIVTVLCKLDNYLDVDTLGKAGHIKKNGTIELNMVKRGKVWLVKMEGLPQSEKQNHD
jgi:hypothetical protein